mmetsp:Transcript_33420/g.89418  ORF Transcript_33420/g.89418 Transcript_33420/m.89418 type:complete len:95 (+) Transcript_33420:1516-1800(+)
MTQREVVPVPTRMGLSASLGQAPSRGNHTPLPRIWGQPQILEQEFGMLDGIGGCGLSNSTVPSVKFQRRNRIVTPRSVRFPLQKSDIFQLWSYL